MFKRILIVDDSLAARMIIRQYLEIAGCQDAEFVEVGNGAEALKALKEQPCDLIVTDMNMPVMNGHDLIKRLKASPKWIGIPIIIVSSAVNQDNQERYMKYGANHIIGKPVSPQLFYRAINALGSQQEA